MTPGGDLLESLQLDDEPEAESPPRETPNPEPQSSVDDSLAPAPSDETPGVASTPAPVASETPPAPVWTPTGEPFRFKVDQTEIAPEGAIVTEHGILFPQQAWDQVRSEYLGNRQVWRQTQEHWQGQLRFKDDQLAQSRQAEQSAVAFVNNLIQEAQKDPAAFVGRLDGIIGGLPERIAHAKIQIYEQRETQRQQEQAQHTAAQATEQLESNVQSFLTQKMEAALAGPFKGLASSHEEKSALLRDLYERHGEQLFEGIDPSAAHLATSQGFEILTQVNGRLVGWYPHRLESILTQRHQSAKQQQAQWQKTAQATQRNTAALAPVPPGPLASSRKAASPPPPRNTSNGQYAKLSPREQHRVAMKASRASLDNLTLDDDD